MGEPLHIALTFNDAYWAPAYATMRSVCLATRRRTDLVFHLLHWQLDPAHDDVFAAITEEFGATVRHVALEAEPQVASLLGSIPVRDGFPPVVYARLLLDALLPEDVARILYLDADLYVRASIERLLDMDLQGKSVAAAPEPGRQRIIAGRDMRTRRGPFDTADEYFNAGVLVIDRAAWKRADLPAFLAALQASGELAGLYHDQDVLNLKFRDDWLRLNPLWNLTRPSPALRSLDPMIVHYTTGVKPWGALAYVAFGSSYKEVMTRDVLARYRRELWRRRFKRLIGR